MKTHLFIALLLIAAQPASADGFGGSFGAEASPEQSNGTTFGGSFTAGEGSAAFGGSFESASGGNFEQGAQTDSPAPAPPGPEPAPPAPQPNPTPEPGIDPQIIAFETRDYGVPPTNQLRSGQFHAATPTAIPGGTFVSTDVLMNALQSGGDVILIDVLGGQYSLPNAFVAPGLAQAGSFNDRTQQQAAQWLSQITGGNKESAIVVFCSDPQCWLSYNAALRVINAGYTAVYWYRGGLQAWQMAGLPMEPASF